MKFIDYQNKKIAYSSEGKGTPVVLLHGFCEDSSIWDDFEDDLLEDNYRVIRIDLPGFGLSEVIPEISIPEMAEAVRAVLLEVSASPVAMIGHSMGGYVTLSFARLFPDMLIGFGLFHSHPFVDSEENKAKRQKSIDFIRRQGHELFVKQLIPTLFNSQFAKSNAFLLEKITYRAAKGEPEGIIAAQQAMMSRKDESETLQQAEVPVLFIIGKKDEIAPPNNMEQVHLPGLSSIHILERAGHMGQFEAKKKTQRIVRQFVEFCEEKAGA